MKKAGHKPTLATGMSPRPVSGRQYRDLVKAGAHVQKRALPNLEGFVEVYNAWLEVPLSDGWMAAYRFANQNGTPVVTEVRVFPRDATLTHRPAGQWVGQWLGVKASVPKGGISSRLLRSLKVASHMQHFHEIAEWMLTKGGDPPEFISQELGRVGYRLLSRRAEPASGRDETFYARVANEYERAGKYPIKTMAARRKVPVERVRAEIYQARELGLLTREGQGKAGGALTDKGRRVLREWKGKKVKQQQKRT